MKIAHNCSLNDHFNKLALKLCVHATISNKNLKNYRAVGCLKSISINY